MNEYNFKKGDVLQLMHDTACHKKGELCVVMEVSHYLTGTTIYVEYESKDGITSSIAEWFRKVDMEFLQSKKEKEEVSEKEVKEMIEGEWDRCHSVPISVCGEMMCNECRSIGWGISKEQAIKIFENN